MSPTGDQLLHWGADNAGAVLLYGQWWRIVSAMFVHVGLLHLATNMWCLWNLGLLANPRQPDFLPGDNRTGGHGFGRGRCGSLGRGLRNCRGADHIAQVAAIAGAPI